MQPPPVAKALRVVAKPAPVIVAQSAVVKAEPLVKSSKSDWLVLLPDEATAQAVVTAPVAPAKPAPAVKPNVYDKAERNLRMRDYEQYVSRKSTDPSSNLK